MNIERVWCAQELGFGYRVEIKASSCSNDHLKRVQHGLLPTVPDIRKRWKTFTRLYGLPDVMRSTRGPIPIPQAPSPKPLLSFPRISQCVN